MQRLLFDYSSGYLVLCLVLGIGYAWLQYSARYNWSKNFNRLLFGLRAVLATSLFVLLLGPVLRQLSNTSEKPALVFLIDNSRSVKETADTAQLLAAVERAAMALGGDKWEVEVSTLDGNAFRNTPFSHGSSDLASALKQVTNRYEGRNLGAMVLFSDGIYNSGISPLYQPLRVPVYAVGVGDSVQRTDLALKNVAYNRVVYQGNKYPLRAEVGVSALPNEEVTVTIRQQGVVMQQLTKNSGNRALLEFDFQLEASKPGMQRLEIMVNHHAREGNKENNRGSAFVEVVEGKKKVVVLAASPHPDIKAFRAVVEKNPNYEFLVHIPGIQELSPAALDPKEVDLLIAHQSPDNQGRTTSALSGFLKAGVPVLVVVGEQTQLRNLSQVGIPVSFESTAQRDEVQPVLNAAFQDLGFSSAVGPLVARYPPVSVPFGKFTFPAGVKTLMVQQIGSLVTERPLLFTLDQESRKWGVLIGDGIWKWRLSEYQETGKTVGFDEWMGKLLQYLSTRDDRRRFRVFPIQQEFSSDGPAILESQVYNELFEPVYGNTIDIQLKGESGPAMQYRYVTGPASGSRYRIGGLKEGIYTFTATTEIGGKREAAKGEFLMVEQSQEVRNLTADFGLLRKLAEGTEGKFYPVSRTDALINDLSAIQPVSTLHTEENFNPLINIKAVFFLLLLLISAEWFLRKFSGAY